MNNTNSSVPNSKKVGSVPNSKKVAYPSVPNSSKVFPDEAPKPYDWEKEPISIDSRDTAADRRTDYTTVATRRYKVRKGYEDQKYGGNKRIMRGILKRNVGG